MGKATRLLTMLVDDELYNTDPKTFDALREKGHTVDVAPVQHDLILSPRAWRAIDTEALAATLYAARKQKYD